MKSAAETKDTAQATVVEEPKKSEMLVKISKVEPNRTQPRKQFDEDALLELSESIKQFGILQPLLVSDKGDYYEIIAGERRWRAAKLAGLKEVPVIIKEFNDQQVVEISLIENIQREDLNPIEEAMAYKRLIDEFKLKQDNIAERVSKSRTAVTNSLRLLKLDERVQQMLIDEMISAGHARAILAITDKDKQTSVAMKVFDEKLSVRETEKLVKHIVEPPKKTQKTVNTAEDAIYESLEEKMKGIMGTRVFIHRKKNNKGKYKVIKEKYTIKVRKSKGIIFIDKDGSYKVLMEDNIIPIKQECFTCKGSSNIYMQELEKKSIRNIYIRCDNLNQELDILYYLPFCVGCIVKGNIVVNNYDKQQYFDIKESYIDYEDDKAANIFKEYKDNYDELNQARINKILRERNE